MDNNNENQAIEYDLPIEYNGEVGDFKYSGKCCQIHP